MHRNGRPAPTEHAPYYGRYIELVAGDDLLKALRDAMAGTRRLVEPMTEARGDYRYETGKWSIKEMLAHVIDTERVFAYRALWFARGDEAPLPGFDQDLWIAGGGFDRRPLQSYLAELSAVRESTLALFGGLDEAAWSRSGTANEQQMSVRAAGYVIAGHELHHQNILRERYA